MFKCLTFIVFLALLAWVFVGFMLLQMYVLALFTGLGLFVVIWEAAKCVSDAATYWECMK